MANVLCKIRCGTWKLLLGIYEPFKVHEHMITFDLRYYIFWWLNLVVCFCWGNYCWFIFVSWSGYCSVSFKSSVWRYLVITPHPRHQETTQCSLFTPDWLRHEQLRKKLYTLRAKSKKLHTLLTLISSSSYWSWLFIVSGLFYKILMLTHQL